MTIVHRFERHGPLLGARYTVGFVDQASGQDDPFGLGLPPIGRGQASRVGIDVDDSRLDMAVSIAPYQVGEPEPQLVWPFSSRDQLVNVGKELEPPAE